MTPAIRAILLTAFLAFTVFLTSGFWKTDDTLRCKRGGAGQYTEAENACRAVIRRFAANPKKKYEVWEAWYNLGGYAESQNRPEEAIEHYTHAISFDNTYSKTFIARAQLFEQAGQTEKAAADLRHVIKTFDETSVDHSFDVRLAHALLGRLQHHTGKHKEAADNLVKGYFSVRDRRDFTAILKSYGFDDPAQVEAYKRGTYVPPQLSGRKPPVTVPVQKTADTPYRSKDPNFAMDDPDFDF